MNWGLNAPTLKGWTKKHGRVELPKNNGSNTHQVWCPQPARQFTICVNSLCLRSFTADYLPVTVFLQHPFTPLFSTYWSSLRPKFVPGSESLFFIGSFLSISKRVLAAEGWGVLGGLMGCRPDGVSDRTWKCEVGGGPMGVGRLSESTWKHKITRLFS